MGNSTVSTYCKGQTVIALSSGEAEYYELVSAASQTLGLQSILLDWDGSSMPTCGRDSRHRDWKPMRARTSETHRHSVPVGADDGQRLTCFVRKSASISLVGFLPSEILPSVAMMLNCMSGLGLKFQSGESTLTLKSWARISKQSEEFEGDLFTLWVETRHDLWSDFFESLWSFSSNCFQQVSMAWALGRRVQNAQLNTVIVMRPWFWERFDAWICALQPTMFHKPFVHSKQHERRIPIHTHIVSSIGVSRLSVVSGTLRFCTRRSLTSITFEQFGWEFRLCDDMKWPVFVVRRAVIRCGCWLAKRTNNHTLRHPVEETQVFCVCVCVVWTACSERERVIDFSDLFCPRSDHMKLTLTWRFRPIRHFVEQLEWVHMHQQIFTYKRGRFVEPTLLDHLYCRWFFVGEQDYKTSMRHDNSNLTAEAHTQCKSWRSDGSPSCLGGFITRVGPGLHPCPLRWRGCGLLTNSTQVRGGHCPNMAAEQVSDPRNNTRLLTSPRNKTSVTVSQRTESSAPPVQWRLRRIGHYKHPTVRNPWICFFVQEGNQDDTFFGGGLRYDEHVFQDWTTFERWANIRRMDWHRKKFEDDLRVRVAQNEKEHTPCSM